jgi:hypothetical protein
VDCRGEKSRILFAVDPKPPHLFFYGRVGFWLTGHSGTLGHLYLVDTKNNEVERKFLGHQLHPDLIDYMVLRSWIESCRLYHPKACTPKERSSLKNIPSFRAIDCYTRKVVLH